MSETLSKEREIGIPELLIHRKPRIIEDDRLVIIRAVRNNSAHRTTDEIP